MDRFWSSFLLIAFFGLFFFSLWHVLELASVSYTNDYAAICIESPTGDILDCSRLLDLSERYSFWSMFFSRFFVFGSLFFTLFVAERYLSSEKKTSVYKRSLFLPLALAPVVPLQMIYEGSYALISLFIALVYLVVLVLLVAGWNWFVLRYLKTTRSR